ncbi:uncharacterized protein YaaN involved in tellurite resistance [Flavobacterium nitrogenifigens]|uniref:Uncharacterized protein YaaN involved in tellurite resistance n=2 Tax=Flavobacterium TaxID=237 RepID=A0A7W7IW08_9FLAO|nr:MULTISPECIES: hypothetical protein [Flavobacterium]MBB4801611.1 uncharacterized protein YaaN involved in tellurite resistance [Flavobacterium nitrogenifigens]MBB6386569.1 uncharacterized protein YaaN involved in tellurite resistance [Flavobacterium notoginsengisoli]
MNGISAREHRIIAAAFDKFEAMSSVFSYVLEESQESEIREGMESLEKLYEKYNKLYGELEKCIKEYEGKKKRVRTAVNKGNRKLLSELQKNPPLLNF